MEINDEGGKPATMLYRGDDGEMREYEIVETHEHESVFQKACPVLPIAIALICAILNLCPGKHKILFRLEIIVFQIYIFYRLKIYNHIFNRSRHCNRCFMPGLL